VLGRWWRGHGAGGLQWAGVTPALFIPIVGNVLVPLAGVPLGRPEWSAAQFGIGLMFWPVVATLILVRVATQGLWPERLLPTIFIFVAPPAVVGLSSLQLGAPPLVGWVCWGMALFSALWCATQARRIAALPFGLPHWGMSFPLAALAALTLRLAGLNPPGTLASGAATDFGPLGLLGLALLALASLLIAALCLATWRGLRDGSLLAPEPVAAIVPAPAATP
jgi:tellurite resistance protein